MIIWCRIPSMLGYQPAAKKTIYVVYYTAAGNGYQKAAEIHQKLGVKHEEATSLIEAGNMYKKTEASNAVDCFRQAVEIYIEMGRFSIAAKHLMTLAEVYENDEANIEQVCMCMYVPQFGKLESFCGYTLNGTLIL